MSKRLYVVAGELSGDAHGAGLLRALKTMVPAVEIHGAGGPAMAAVAGPGLRDWVEDAAVMGVWEVLKRYGWFKQRFAEMLDEVRVFRPDVLVLIDYPGFNLRFAEAVRRESPETRLVYYVSPQVWAWHRGRIPKMARLLDEMLCLFPFEQPIFEEAGLKTTFVGHPLVDELEENKLMDSQRELSLVGLFPGSREREIARLFPMMIERQPRADAAGRQRGDRQRHGHTRGGVLRAAILPGLPGCAAHLHGGKDIGENQAHRHRQHSGWRGSREGIRPGGN